MLFQCFVDRIETKSVLEDKNDSFSVVLPSDKIASIFSDDDYFACFSHYIYYNPERCDEAGLLNEERMSLIAHELGHYYDETPRDYSQIREMNADRFAIDIVPSHSLLSALIKLWNAVPEGYHKDNLDMRIKKLHELIDSTND